MNIEDLTPELMEKAKACTCAEAIAKLAKEEGYELTDDQLEAVSGGAWICSCDGANTCESKEVCVGHGRGI